MSTSLFLSLVFNMNNINTILYRFFNANSCFLLGRIYYDRNQLEKSEFFFERGVELCPAYSSSVYFLLAEIQIQNHEYDKAKDNLLSYLRFLDISQKDRDKVAGTLKEVSFRDSLIRNPVAFNPSPVKGVSTEFDEVLPILSPDNELMFLLRSLKIAFLDK